MIYRIVPFPVTLSDLTQIWRSRGYYRCTRRTVCTADARSICESQVLVLHNFSLTSIQWKFCHQL